LIDSSAWIEFLNGSPSATAEQVSRNLGGEADLCTCGLIVTEVLQGLRRDAGLQKVVSLFQELTFLEPSGIATYLRAAEVYRELRRRGTTVRSTIDCLIAVLAEEHGCTLLARDRDLELILGGGLVKTSLLAPPE
jgi:hypothetical protein